MQYAVRTPAVTTAPDALERLLHRLDPAALVDRDPLTGELRVSSFVGADTLREVLLAAGIVTAPHEVARLPSECCGGCGG
jgi:hypothetical protein